MPSATTVRWQPRRIGPRVREQRHGPASAIGVVSFLATDVGGTFTDLVHYDAGSGRISVAKTLTTPDDPSRGVLNAIADGQTRGFLSPAGIDRLIHGGTTVINAITERKGAVTALVTTAGFRDVLEIGRGNRPDLYNLHAISPPPFVPRRLRFEVRERMDARGNVLLALDGSDLDAIALACEREGVAAIAVAFLNSYANPSHEQRCAAALRARLPGVAVTASHDISRQWREYERTSTAVLNAYVMPVVDRYFDRLEQALGERGFRRPFFAMQSNGGMASFEWARTHPLSLVESGPAGGVSGAAAIGEWLGEPDVLYLDIGGTTAKCGVVHAGMPRLTTEYRLERTRTQPGYPVQLPVVDIVEIGAGGGSIAWFDEGGALRVGPASAGAAPGPACYGFGGTDPTITDAMLIAGVLDRDSFAGGSLRLDVDAAIAAMARIADRLGDSVEAAANAVIRIAEANMLNALKLVTIQRGHDPRDLTLVASGGGGPIHAARLARELGVRRLVIPPYPGVFSAWGMLVSAPRRDVKRTRLLAANAGAVAAGQSLFADMEREAAAYFGVEAGALRYFHAVEMRYRGQEHTVAVTCRLDEWNVDALLAAFHEAHEQAYTFRLDTTAAEVVSFHLKAELVTPRPTLVAPATASDAGTTATATRCVDHGAAGRMATPVRRREALAPGHREHGPLLIEESSSTTVVLPGQRVTMDAGGLLLIEEHA